MAKANNTYMRDYDKNQESSYSKYWDVNNLYGYTMAQNLSVNNLEWTEGTSQVNKNFIKTMMKKVIGDIFSKLIFTILKNCMNLIRL